MMDDEHIDAWLELLKIATGLLCILIIVLLAVWLLDK